MANDGTKILDELKTQADGILAGDISADSNMLVEILSIASDLYYNAASEDDKVFVYNGSKYIEAHDDVFLTDAQYDALEKMLKAMDPNNSFLATVGSDVRGGKVPLPVTMGSLDQVYEGDTIVWVQNNKWQNENFVLTDKMDGTSGLIVYGKGGMLTIAYSRGNGTEGADITRHIKNILGIPKKMPISCMVRVEVEMADEVFAKLMVERAKRGERVYENPRNYVAGRMNASESPQEFYDNVSAFATSLIEPEMGKLDQLEMLEKAGWTVPDYIVCKGNELVDEDLIAYLEGRRNKTKFAIDGIVIDLDDPEIRRSLYQTRSTLNPAYSKKFKVGSEENVATATVVNVHWDPSKSGYLKPTVEIVPTKLGGVTITNLTAFNAKFVFENKIGPGAVIKFTRSGEVIPHILEILKPMPL
jgi:NAD-dependent DNA ligase